MACGPTYEPRNTQSLDLRFCAVLTEGDVQVLFHREASERLDDACFSVEAM